MEGAMQGSTHLDLTTLLIWFSGVIVFVMGCLMLIVKFFLSEKYKAITKSMQKVDEVHSWYLSKKDHDDRLSQRINQIDKDFAVFKAEQKQEREFYKNAVSHIRDNIDNKLSPIHHLVESTEKILLRVEDKLNKG